ncbi:RHS repeat-associated protein [Microbacterium foliorum]|uniref:RHS repeat-associated core domain-containing protein n=1 Tax=Microbacterium foliorum TaxID=104336 RepID=UPI00209F1ED1|nr:RHS repeat-associated core domain-containing protein [Microbacterium foliorum]MCP1428026.1 RHS repeat-associated protein [Microbacterium foliorum]
MSTVTGPAGVGPGSYTYDAAGNMTGRPGQAITFNDVGKVSKVVAGAVTQNTVYNVDGSILLRTNTSEGATLFVGDTVLSQANGSTVVAGVRTYSGAEGKPIAEKSAKSGTAGTTLTWLFSNLEGTVDVRTVATAAGTTTRTFRDPYGAPIGSSGVWSSGTGYMNKPVTASTGLTTVGARTYDPVVGKFLSVDPVIDTNLPQQNTGYTYSGNNPTTYMDPTGLRLSIGCEPRCGKGAATVAQNLTSRATPAVAGAKKDGSCKPGDWTCRVNQSNAEVKCTGAGRFRSCDRSAGVGIWSYSYRDDALVSTGGKFTAAEVMDVFKAHPSKIFPFKVEGCPTFKTGIECNLYTGTPLLNPNGVVGVTTTSTSVNFTVLERGYFDAPGSTIKFSTWDDKRGNVYLSRVGVAYGADALTWFTVGLLHSAGPTWDEQAVRLSNMLKGAQ